MLVVMASNALRRCPSFSLSDHQGDIQLGALMVRLHRSFLEVEVDGIVMVVVEEATVVEVFEADSGVVMAVALEEEVVSEEEEAIRMYDVLTLFP